jgi:hypothetical protein
MDVLGMQNGCVRNVK